jgi:DinB superfamily
MFTRDLEMLRLSRAETLRLASGVTQEQSEFSPAPGKWSAGEVLDHLLLAENYYRSIFVQLIEMKKSGARPVISSSFADVNTSIAYIPRFMLPWLEIPFTVFNMFVPTAVREAMTQISLLPAQNPDMATPLKGKPVGELRDALRSSYEETAALFQSNPGLDYRGMRYRHPLLGDNNMLHVLRIVGLHERRHHSQIRDILRVAK